MAYKKNLVRHQADVGSKVCFWKNDFAAVWLWSGNSRPDFYSGPHWYQAPYLVNFFIRDSDASVSPVGLPLQGAEKGELPS